MHYTNGRVYFFTLLASCHFVTSTLLLVPQIINSTRELCRGAEKHSRLTLSKPFPQAAVVAKDGHSWHNGHCLMMVVTFCKCVVKCSYTKLQLSKINVPSCNILILLLILILTELHGWSVVDRRGELYPNTWTNWYATWLGVDLAQNHIVLDGCQGPRNLGFCVSFSFFLLSWVELKLPTMSEQCWC